MLQFRYILLLLLVSSHCLGQQDNIESSTGAINRIELPSLIVDDTRDPIIIAVIDDAYSNHHLLAPFIYSNPNENPFNGIDDDGNGAVDDLHGYDVSDIDTDVQPPADLSGKFYHGTMTAGTIVQLLTDIYGPQAADHFKILPVKVIGDNDDPNRIKDGYKGVAYAIKSKADLIICAWNGGSASSEEIQIIKDAIAANIPVIAAGGNSYGNLVQAPGNIDGVITVAAVDRDYKRLYTSAYGAEVDISYFGDNWMAPSSSDPNGYLPFANTSLATSLTAGIVAAAIHEHGKMSPLELRALLQNTATPIDEYNPNLWGQLGAGVINPTTLLNNAQIEHNAILSEGIISTTTADYNSNFNINPIGDYKETQLHLLNIDPWSADQKIRLMSVSQDTVFDISVNDLYQPYTINGSDLMISTPGLTTGTSFSLKYESIPFDSTTMFCQEVNIVTSGIIEDGSGDNLYANGSNCTWQLVSEEGTRLKITVELLDTEAKADHLYIFDGNKTTHTDMMARLSGSEIPPIIYGRSNKVLIWFVSDDKTRKGGWRIKAEAY